MPKFTIIETVPCIQQWEYEVEAATETEALEKMLSGKADILDVTVTEHDYEAATYDFQEHDEPNKKLTDEINQALKDGYDDYEQTSLRGKIEMEDDNTQDDDGFRTFNESPYGQDDDEYDGTSWDTQTR